MANRSAALLLAVALTGCSGSHEHAPPAPDGGAPDLGGGDLAPAATCRTPATPEDCTPPAGTALPLCTLALTGCMDPQKPTQPIARAVAYEVNSPLWSDSAAKARAFVLPAGGKIHVENCDPGSSDPACTSSTGLPAGAADSGRWRFPVGTVMIKSFLFDGKLVETRLFMHVDAATRAMIMNGTDWVGFTYAWNEAQTEATLVPDERTTVQFATGKRTVTWNYPSRLDCIGCHNGVVNTLGPETAQMNRMVSGQNQIDRFAAAGLFEVAPQKPYATALVEPYANADLGLSGPGAATVDEAARSYLAANCSFCHRPDVNDQGFDLRHALTLYQTGICGLLQQNGIPGMTTQMLFDLSPGKHAESALWIRMNIPIADSNPHQLIDVGRMPTVSSFVVDAQAVDLVGKWIDGIASCPTE